ncbi:MAG: hypothetical protein J6U58_07535 [Bacteroidaceae bacterium]|nr:hypothetical protein [Bacteroidaceae bacterium]
MSRTRYISLMTVVIVVIAIVMEFVMKRFFPSQTSSDYLFIPLFYLLFYTVSAIFLFKKYSPLQFAKVMLIVKGVKMIISLFVLLILSFVMRGEGLGVIVNFIVYFLVLLIPESVGLISLKNRLAVQGK